MNETFETRYLKYVLSEIERCIALLDLSRGLDLKKSLAFLEKQNSWGNLYEMSPGRLTSVRRHINRAIDLQSNDTEGLRDRYHALKVMADSPYFGKITFVNKPDSEEALAACSADDWQEPEDIYIGIRDFYLPGSKFRLVYDWRDPLSTMFYNYSLGPASYEAGEKAVNAQLLDKLQFHIEGGQLQYVLEIGETIDDELLKRELSRASTPKMQTIVNTIQREQNAAIRDETTQYLAVLGFAGSGKTSIALHRIAFLLYRNSRLQSSDILILSPNKIFSNYISTVLPELGEENIMEVSFKDLVLHELKDIPCETRAMQLERLLNEEDPNAMNLIQFKKSTTFVNKLKAFPAYFGLHFTTFEDINVFGTIFDGRKLEHLFFEKFYSEPVFVRISHMAEFLCDVVETKQQVSISAEKRQQILEDLLSFVNLTSLTDIYRAFLKWANVAEASQFTGGRLPNEDVFPMIYLKYLLFGNREFSRIKHLIIDEMQDYSIVQYEIIKMMVHCPITFLGDSSQAILGGNVNVVLKSVFPQIKNVELKQSYRSTYEITKFSSAFMQIPGVIPFERHGALPVLYSCPDPRQERQKLRSLIEECQREGYSSIAILSRSEKEAARYYRRFKKELPDTLELTLITAGDREFVSGAVVTCSLLSKGLEFDAVLIPNVSDTTCHSPLEYRLLYVACTRALHKLCLFTPQEAPPKVFAKAEGLYRFEPAS